MTAFEDAALWRSTLAPRTDDEASAARERLREAYLRMRERAALVAQQIAIDLPDLTVHDETHFDALWELASLVGGDVEVTPPEAFLLGASFLIHDLGLGLAAFPDGLRTLQSQPLWRDSIAQILRARFGRSPTAAEIEEATEDVRLNATRQMLRMLHAQRAEWIATEPWVGDDGEPLYLLQDEDLRYSYGHLIGQLAHSHWWPTASLEGAFPSVQGAPAWQAPACPMEWTIDPLKIACLLRVADAIHLDARRAPRLLKALRRPNEQSMLHWHFQEKLNRPILEGDKVAFTAARGFPVHEAPAWWLCFDTLRSTDRYLFEVDALLSETQRPRLRARGVAGVEDPLRLAQRIPTEGWVPVDAQVHVSDVARLVRHLGGEELYGKNKHVALRELLQNAADAVRARRTIEERVRTYGRIDVRLGRDELGQWLEVEDDGVGMSRTTLTEVLLDFGTSYWDTPLAIDELPGLLSSGFTPTGRYGIGFFAVLMLGDHLRVTTRKFEDAQRETMVLEFQEAARSRPTLREANENEWLRDGGTRVRVWLRSDPFDEGGLFWRWRREPWSLVELAAWLAPGLDVDVLVDDEGTESVAVENADWLVLDPSDLVQRVALDEDLDRRWAGVLELVGHMRPLNDQGGAVVGRAFIVPRGSYNDRFTDDATGVVTVGGLRATDLGAITGILCGSPERAARDIAIPLVSAPELGRWASDQALLLAEAVVEPHLQAAAAETVISCGGDPRDLAIAETADGWKTFDQLAAWAKQHSEILATESFQLEWERERGSKIDLLPNVVAFEQSHMTILRTSGNYQGDWPPGRRFEGVSVEDDALWYPASNSSFGAVVRAIAVGWEADPVQVLEASNFRVPRKDVELGERDGKPFRVRPEAVLRRP